MSERMWISEQLEQARTERDQARLELAALRAERTKIAAVLREAIPYMMLPATGDLPARITALLAPTFGKLD